MATEPTDTSRTESRAVESADPMSNSLQPEAPDAVQVPGLATGAEGAEEPVPARPCDAAAPETQAVADPVCAGSDEALQGAEERLEPSGAPRLEYPVTGAGESQKEDEPQAAAVPEEPRAAAVSEEPRVAAEPEDQKRDEPVREPAGDDPKAGRSASTEGEGSPSLCGATEEPAPVLLGEVETLTFACARDAAQEAPSDGQSASDSVPEAGVAPADGAVACGTSTAEREPEIPTDDSTSEPSESSEPDFSEEDAERDAREAGVDLGEENESEETADGEEPVAPAPTDFQGLSKRGLVEYLSRLLETRPIASLRGEIEAIKIAFYKLHRAEVDAARRAFVEAGGREEEFSPRPDTDEANLRELFRLYRDRRDAFLSGIEAAKEENLRLKWAIIEELKQLADSGETLNHTFNQFRDLQRRWRETGPVPQTQVKDVWETYNLHVENFYNYIKIDKELRDLDLRRNYEAKIALCEQAEALVAEPSVVEAFRRLQKLHDEWRETGPVAPEQKETIWERFKVASTQINKLHQGYFDGLKAEQQQNLELKSALCDETEALAAALCRTRKEWNRASDRLLEIQRLWKTIGFAPKKDNNRIYDRFRRACDAFFTAKRAYYTGLKSEMDHNLDLKEELCRAAESLAESEEWKTTTDEMLGLQKRWKEIGAVPHRQSEAVWRRFRAACDRFFTRKSAHFKGVDSEQEEHLRLKEALLDEMRAAEAADWETIREFQRRWGEIGYVPIRHKERIQRAYKEVADALFDRMRKGERDRGTERYHAKVTQMKGTGDRRLRTERDRLYAHVRQLEQDIQTLENNIGFFARSKNAEALIRDVEAKIDRAKAEMAATIEKVRVIDSEQQSE